MTSTASLTDLCGGGRPDPIESYLATLGVPHQAPRIFPFDPGYDPETVISHLAQSGRLMAGFKLSMTCWQLAAPDATRAKIAAAHEADVPLVAGGANFEIAVQRGTLREYLQLCAQLGIDCVEAGEGFTDLAIRPEDAVGAAQENGIEVQFELGRKDEGAFTRDRVSELVEQGRRWLEAGAVRLVIEARESALGIGLFDERGRLRGESADMLADQLGLDVICFEAPTKSSQFQLLKHLGPDVFLSNVRLEEILRVEIFRRGLHADSYFHESLGAWHSVTARESSVR